MAWVELVLKREMRLAMRRSGKLGPVDEFAGMYVSEEEIRHYLSNDEPQESSQGPDLALRELEESLRMVRLNIDRRAALAIDRGVELRLQQLAHRFELSETEIRIVVLCLAADVDIRFHRCFAFLQNDVNKKRPSIQFLARVCESFCDVLEARWLLGPQAPLLRHRLLLLPQSSSNRDVPLPIQQPIVCSGVIDFLFGQERVDERLANRAELIKPRQLETFGSYDRHHRSIRNRLLRSTETCGDLPLAYISGPAGSQRARLVEQLAHDLDRRVLRIRTASLLAASAGIDECLALLGRDARLHAALIHLHDAEDLVAEDGRPGSEATALRTWLTSDPCMPVLLTGTCAAAELGHVLAISFSAYELPLPSSETSIPPFSRRGWLPRRIRTIARN